MKSTDSIHYYEYHAKRLMKASGDWPSLKAELAPFLEMLNPGGRVLDLGCGAGQDLRIIHEAKLRVVGIEGARTRADQARTLNPEVEVQEKNFLFLTLKEAEFDGVWAKHSLHHFSPEATQRIVATLFRGMKTGGALGLVVYEGAAPFEDREGDLSGPSRYLHPWSEKGISSLIEQTGFAIKKVGRQIANPSRGNPLPGMLILARKI